MLLLNYYNKYKYILYCKLLSKCTVIYNVANNSIQNNYHIYTNAMHAHKSIIE